MRVNSFLRLTLVTSICVTPLTAVAQTAARKSDSRAAGSRAQITRIAEKIFKGFDRNRDGSLDQKEFATLPSSTKKRLGPAFKDGGTIDRKTFTRHLSSLTPAMRRQNQRVAQYRLQKRSSPSPNKRAATGKLEIVGSKLPQEYAKLDKDKDGQIGLYEWPKKEIAKFVKLDKNRDGFVTPRELGALAKVRVTKKASTKAAPAKNSSSKQPPTERNR